MLKYIQEKYKKYKRKRTFQEYGYELRQFDLAREGKVSYAQWKHPSESLKEMNQQKVDFIRQFVNEGDFIIDIGAHTGDTTVPMALAVGKSGLTLALEPNPYVYKVLEKNASLNKDKTNIVPLNVAATETEGKFVFHYSDASFCNGGFFSKIKNQNHHHNFELEVKGINLRTLLYDQYKEQLNRLKLVKIDAEGYDRFIIHNMLDVLQNYRPYLITECLKKLTKEERIELYKVIVEADYRPYHLGESEELELLRPESMMKWKHFDILGIPNENPKTKLDVITEAGQF